MLFAHLQSVASMGLEENIQQKEFTTEIEKATVNISFTQSYISALLNSSFKTYNISIQQFNVLRILQGQHPKPVSVNDITLRMIDKMSNASRLVEKLFNKNLVGRAKCSYDKRQVDVSITKEGQNTLNKLNKHVEEFYQSHNQLSNDELITLNELLDKLRKD
jgi:DNA-binding MarR family transcriptional regulator